MAGTNCTTRLEGILTSNSVSQPSRVGALTPPPFEDAGHSGAYSFVLGCTDDS